MPVPKRYHPVSRDLNDDPEVWELTDTKGEKALRVWLEVLALIDRNENRLELSPSGVAAIARKTRTKRDTVSGIVRWCVDKNWLVVTEFSPDGSPLIYEARNYWKYHRKRETNGSQASSPPKLSETNLSSLDKEKKLNKEKKNDSSIYYNQQKNEEEIVDDRSPEVKAIFSRLLNK